jgi:hypothetical protein
MFGEKLEGNWRSGEIAEATRIVAFPSPHDRRARPNHPNVIYPDRAGLISFLRRMSAL